MLFKRTNLTKPEEVLTFTQDMHFGQIKRGEADGKSNTIKIAPQKDSIPLLMSASSEDSLAKWLRALKKISNALKGIVNTPAPEKEE